MEVHKPKPVHSWREFISEIAVVVIGVVIALSADQMLQGLELRAKVRHAEQQMRAELALDDGPQVLRAMRELGIRVVLDAKQPSEVYAPAGPSRVLDQLRRLPMAAACLPALERAMRDSS